MELTRKKIRLLVLGDQSVGKTSLIYSIISQLPVTIERTLKKVVLPPDMCMYSKQVFTEIIDTAPSDTDLIQELVDIDIILLVYDVSSQQSVTRIEQYWLPLLQQQAPKIPIILVGNKLDKVELRIQQDHNYINIRQIITKMTRHFRQVQMGIQCSAYKDRNVKAVLNSAQRAVLYPLAPLYNLSTRELTPKFTKALIRIFRILDKDMDGKLSDIELRSLQSRVFQSQLNPEDIRVIREIISKQLEDIHEDYITLEGFIALQKKCIQMLKIQISWSILRYFHYNNNLELKTFDDKLFINEGQSTELTLHAINFLHGLYSHAVRNSQNTIEFIFSCSPVEDYPLRQFYEEAINLEYFLLSWNYLAHTDYLKCYKYLEYIGYQSSIGQTFTNTYNKSSYSSLLKLKERKVLSVAIFEAQSYYQYFNGIFTSNIEQNHIKRQFKLLSYENHSKILLLYKVPEEQQKNFMQSAQCKKLDLILTFNEQKHQQLQKRIREVCPKTLFVKNINKEQAEKTLNIFNLGELDLNVFPIKYNNAAYDKLYKHIMSIIANIQLGLPKETIQQLKAVEKTQKYVFIGIALAIGIGLTYLFKNRLKS